MLAEMILLIINYSVSFYYSYSWQLLQSMEISLSLSFDSLAVHESFMFQRLLITNVTSRLGSHFPLLPTFFYFKGSGVEATLILSPLA